MPKQFNSLASKIITEIALELGLKVDIEPEYGYVGRIRTPQGKYFYFRNTTFDLNGHGAGEIAKDKGYSAFFMKLMGYPIPASETFYSDSWAEIVGSNKTAEAAYLYAETIGYPVIVKPNNRSQGVGVEKALSPAELKASLENIFTNLKERVALVQSFVKGEDYRIVTLDQEVIAVYRRSPLSVVGNGVNTISQLLELKRAQFQNIGRKTGISINQNDPRIIKVLKRSSLNYASIPKLNEKIVLLDNANLSAGGEAQDVTDITHTSYKEMAIKLTEDMGLRHCGIDIITEHPIHEPIKDYMIIEINGSPGLDHYSTLGEKQMEIVKSIYRKILLAMMK